MESLSTTDQKVQQKEPNMILSLYNQSRWVSGFKILPNMMILKTKTKQYLVAKQLAMTFLAKDMVKDLHTGDNLEKVMSCLTETSMG
jgi:hypothetical protein